MSLRYVFLAGIALMAPGCAGRDVIVQKQTEMEARLEYLAQSNKALIVQVAGLSEEVKELKDKVRNQSEAAARERKESDRAAGANESQSVQTPAVTKIEVINGRGRNDAASTAYMEAFGLYSADNYPAAIESFTAFLEKYPDTDYAMNAQYWIGECYYSRSDLPKALESFRKVVKKYPKGKKVPDAMLKIGYTLFAMREPVKAKAALAELVEKYPDSPAAAKARERLGR